MNTTNLADYEAACFWAQELNIPQKDRADYIRRKKEQIRRDRIGRERM